MITKKEAERWIGKPAVIVWDEDDIEVYGAGGIVERVQDGQIRLRADEDEDPESSILNWSLEDVLRIDPPDDDYQQVIKLTDKNIFQ